MSNANRYHFCPSFNSIIRIRAAYHKNFLISYPDQNLKSLRLLVPKLISLLLLLFQLANPVQSQEAKLMFGFGHTGKVMYAIFSPDGKRIVTTSMDKTGKIWDATSGQVLTDLKGNDNFVYTAEFSPERKTFLTVSFDSTVKIWDASTGDMIHELQGHKDAVWGAHYSKDGKKIVSCSRDNTAKIWDAQTGKLLRDLTGHESFIQNASFTEDGQRVATASYDKSVRVWDVNSGSAIQVIKHHKGFVYSAMFSRDGKQLVTASGDSTARIFDVQTGRLMYELTGHRHQVWAAEYSADNKWIATASFNGEVKIWNASNGKLAYNLDGHTAAVWHLRFSPDDKWLVSASDDKTFKVWDVFTGKLLVNTVAHKAGVKTAFFSHDGKRIVTCSEDKTAKIWDATSGKLLMNLSGNATSLYSVQTSPNGKHVLLASGDNSAKIWDINEAKIIEEFKGHTDSIHKALFSPVTADDPVGGKHVLTISADKTAKLWHVKNGNLLADLKRHSAGVTSAAYSSDGKLIATGSNDNTAKLWDASNGTFLRDLKGHLAPLWAVAFSSDGKLLVTTSKDGTAKVWEIGTGKIVADLKHASYDRPEIFNRVTAEFSPDNARLVTTGVDSLAVVWDIVSGKPVLKLAGHGMQLSSAKFSADGKKIITASFDKTAKIWDATTGSLLNDLKGGHSFYVKSAEFTSDGTKAITISRDNTVKVWDISTGAILNNFSSNNGSSFWTGEAEYASFTPDGKNLITASGKSAVSIWDTKTGDLLYTFFTANGSDYLVLDKDGRYDGTEAAKKLLYFSCGTEVISLEQVKGRLWVPNLASRVMQRDVISNAKLSDLNICAYAPQVEMKDRGHNIYEFNIKPRVGGLGETVLYVNNIEVKRYKPSELQKNGSDYVLTVKKDDLKNLFVPGSQNYVQVKSFVASNDVSSRGVGVTEETEAKSTAIPKLYAIIIGVSDYKGEGLDLKYAAKDANDISKALNISASKLLGKENVFIYNLTTDKERYRLPEKKSIRDLFAEIGKLSTPNDVLMVFFAGHGVVEGEQKQFYFLTADATVSSVTPTELKEVGIGVEEMMEWMKPANIKAQKRILVMDACHSGSAINQMVTIGQDKGYTAARSDDKIAELKQIDKLNEKSGMYILAASASNQSAYELSRYSQGLLTYSLLKVIKTHPELLEQNKFLNVSNWFNQAVKVVGDIVRESNLRQEPQLITTTNFPIGVVDEEVLSKIVLPNEKPLFANSNFQNNDEAIADDDLELSKFINQQLNEISSRSTDAPITYVTGSSAPDAFTLSGRYTVQGNEITVKTNIRQHKTVKHSFELKGQKEDLKALAAQIVRTASEWIAKK
jgi:WD40 repeat protein/uncharacterized caspase-like protein